MALAWEHVENIGSPFCLRARVPGGWFVLVQYEGAVSITFYPDPEHEWDGNSLPDAD